MRKLTKIPAILIIVTPIIFYFVGSSGSRISIGRMVNAYFPCVQNPVNSFPCYGIYDLYFMGLLAVVFFVSIIVLIAAKIRSSSADSQKEVSITHASYPSASRAPSLHIAPVFIAGMRYAQIAGDLETDGQVGGILGAYDASNRELWRLKVYANPRRPDLEGDVQDVWFRSLRAEGDQLWIENERRERFEVDPAARRVLSCHPPVSEPKSDIDPISGQTRIRRP